MGRRVRGTSMRANEGCGAGGQPHCDRNSPGPGRPFVSFEEEEEGGEEKTARKHTQALLRPSTQEDNSTGEQVCSF